MQCGLDFGFGNITGCLDKFLDLRPGDEDFTERGARLEKFAFYEISHGFCAAVKRGGGLLDVI